MALTKIPASLLDTTAGLTVAGDLTVSGTTTTVNSTTLDVADKNITINKGSGDTSSTADGAGITIQDAVNSSTDATMLWDTTDDRFDFSHNLHIGTANQVGSASVPALQIGGTSTYRLGMYTTSEGAIIDNANGDDGLIFHTKTAGEAMRITSEGDVGIGTTTPKNLSGQNSLTINGSVSRIDFKISNTFRHAIITEAEYLNLSIDPDNNQSNSRFSISVDNSEKLRIDSAGNVGIGNTPQTIYSTFDSLQIGPNKSMILGRSENSLFGTTSNAYINSSGSWTYVNNGLAAMTEMINGEHHWFTASSGTAGNAISFQRRMSIMSSGRIGIGTNSPSGSLHLTTVDSDGSDVYYVAQNTTSNRLSGYKILDESGNNYVSLLYDNGSNKGQLNLGQSDGEILYVYGGSSVKSGFGIDLSGSSRELSMFHTSSGTDGNISFGKRAESGGAYTEAMRITGSGYVGINESSPAVPLHVQGMNQQAGTARFDPDSNKGSNVSYIHHGTHGDIYLRSASTSGDVIIQDTGGYFFVGKSALSLTTAGMIVTGNDYMSYTNTATDTGDRCVVWNRQSASYGDFQAHRIGNTNVGVISINSSGNMVYGGTSDYRLKENVNYTWDATTLLKQLKPCKFEWKSDNYDTVNQGFLAHEVQDVIPQAVMGDKDAVDSEGEAVHQQLDNSQLVPLLVKTIQELEARIATLEG